MTTKEIYLARFRRLHKLHKEQGEELNEKGRRLLIRCQFETFEMCKRLGVEDEAKEMLMT